MSLYALTLHELSGKLRKREVSSVEVTESVFNRIAATEERIHSYLALCRDSALKEARQADERLKNAGDCPPLTGIPIALKDIFLSNEIGRASCRERV